MYWSKWIIRLKLIWCKGSQLIEKEIYELTGLEELAVKESKRTGFRYRRLASYIQKKYSIKISMVR